MNIFFRVYQVIGDSKTNHDFGFDNNNNNKKNKIGCQRCYKRKEKPFEGGTLSCYESFLPKAQCKIFHNNSIKEMKFSMSIQGKLCHNCFPAHCKCINFYVDGVPVQDFFSYPYALAGYFFSKSPSPNPFSKLLSICITSKNQFYQQDMIESSHSHSKELLSLIFSKHFIKNTTQPTEATLRE